MPAGNKTLVEASADSLMSQMCTMSQAPPCGADDLPTKRIVARQSLEQALLAAGRGPICHDEVISYCSGLGWLSTGFTPSGAMFLWLTPALCAGTV